MDYTHAKKPVGGFIFLTITQLAMVWWAYRERFIRLKDLRVWFAAQELVARRCKLKAGQRPHYSLNELHKVLAGRGGENDSIRRLSRVGLLAWSSTAITFATSPEEFCVGDVSGFHEMLAQITNARRLVPVPRRIVRLIAAPSKRCVIATVLGHLMRCLYYQFHVKQCVSGGFCKASWIAEVFKVDVRNVKAARKFLVESLGWLTLIETPQRVLNRFGQRAMIDLTWTGSVVDKLEKKEDVLPPPEALSTTSLPPLTEHKEPFQEHKHQEPAPQGPSGVLKAREEKSPTLRHVVPKDLRDTERLLVLFDEAQTLGLIGASESERLTFVATAERARLVGSTNPPGLFAHLVRRRLFHFVTQDDEERAQSRLKQHFYREETVIEPSAVAPARLSKDAHFVAVVQAKLLQAGLTEDAFSLVSRELPDWTRERWEKATEELTASKRGGEQGRGFQRVGDFSLLSVPKTRRHEHS